MSINSFRFKKRRAAGLIRKGAGAFLLFMAVCVIYTTTCNLTYAIGNDVVKTKDNRYSEEASLLIHIDEKGKVSYQGNLFEEGYWYPGKESSGIIRIENEFAKIQIISLKEDIRVAAFSANYDEVQVKDSVLRNLKLTIGDNQEGGFDSNQPYIEKGETVDLNYLLVMDEASGNELQGMAAKVAITMAFEQR